MLAEVCGRGVSFSFGPRCDECLWKLKGYSIHKPMDKDTTSCIHLYTVYENLANDFEYLLTFTETCATLPKYEVSVCNLKEHLVFKKAEAGLGEFFAMCQSAM